MSEKRVADMTRSELRGTIQSAVLIANIALGVLYAVFWLTLKLVFGVG
jgi:hypothetical protein